MPNIIQVPNCLDVPRKRWDWQWKAFERARFPSYQRNRSLFGRMLNRIYDTGLNGFRESITLSMGFERAASEIRRLGPDIIESTYRTAYENTAQEFAQGFEQNLNAKQFIPFIGDDEGETEEENVQDIATLALLAVRDYFTARLFAQQQRLTLSAQVRNIVNTHAGIATQILEEQARQVLGVSAGQPLPNVTPEEINSIALSARNRFRNQVTPKHSQFFSITETVAASNLGTLAVARARQQRTGQVLSKFWLSQRDSRVRDSHAVADSAQIPLDGLFRVGTSLLAFPGDWTHGAELKEIINCRCVLIYFSQN